MLATLEKPSTVDTQDGGKNPKRFKMIHEIHGSVTLFDETDPPGWLLGGRPGSTMDLRWFWTGHVLTLDVGQSVQTECNTIIRVD